VIFLLRRAAAKSRARAPSSARDRLGVGPAEEPPGPAASAAPAPGRAGEAPQAEREAEAAAEREAEVEAEAPPTDAEAAAAYKAGLAKTRGWVRPRLGKLSAEEVRRPDAQELEEVLFTADIARADGPIFQSVERPALSKDDLEDSEKI